MTKPIILKRGSTFAYLVTIPNTLPDGYFADWEVEAHIRRLRNDTPQGLIARMATRWENSLKTRRLVVWDAMTDKWPIGPAEMDVLFTNVATGYRIPTKTVLFDIQRGITR